MRAVLGVIAGMIAAFVCVQGAEMITHQLYPFPPGADMRDMATIKRFVATLPPAAFALVIAGWLAGTLLGTFTAAKIGPEPHSRLHGRRAPPLRRDRELNHHPATAVVHGRVDPDLHCRAVRRDGAGEAGTTHARMTRAIDNPPARAIITDILAIRHASTFSM